MSSCRACRTYSSSPQRRSGQRVTRATPRDRAKSFRRDRPSVRLSARFLPRPARMEGSTVHVETPGQPGQPLRRPHRRPPPRRSLSRRSPHRPWRHGQCPRGHRHPARPHGRGEDHAPGPRRRRRVRRPLRPRGAGGRAALPPQRRRRLRPGRRRTAPSSSSWSMSRATPCATSSARKSPMSPSRALSLLDPVLSALADAHRAGLIHRDVKPENVLIADDGRVKVADFGLAKAVSADTQHTATGGVLIGTVSYLAPELVIDGQVRRARRRLRRGCRPLRDAHRPQAPRRRVADRRSPTSTSTRTSRLPLRTSPDLPPYVDALVARATSRDRHNRPADAGCSSTRCTGSARR